MPFMRSRPKRSVRPAKPGWDPSLWATRVPLTHTENFQEVQDVSLSHLTVTGPSADGISATYVNNLTLRGSSITGAGNGYWEHNNLRLENLQGTLPKPVRGPVKAQCIRKKDVAQDRHSGKKVKILEHETDMIASPAVPDRFAQIRQVSSTPGDEGLADVRHTHQQKT